MGEPSWDMAIGLLLELKLNWPRDEQLQKLKKRESELRALLNKLEARGGKATESFRYCIVGRQLELIDGAKTELCGELWSLRTKKERMRLQQITPRAAFMMLKRQFHNSAVAGAAFALAVFALDRALDGQGKHQILGGIKAAKKRRGEVHDSVQFYSFKYYELKESHPRWGHVRLTDEVGAQWGVTGRTVREYIPNPKPRRRKNKLEAKS